MKSAECKDTDNKGRNKCNIAPEQTLHQVWCKFVGFFVLTHYMYMYIHVIQMGVGNVYKVLIPLYQSKVF